MTTLRQPSQRVPPHNLESEESVLGAMLLSETSIADVLERLRPDDFYKPAHRTIFEAVVSLFGRGEPVDSVTVAEELRRLGGLEEVGGKPYLFHLVSSVPAASNATYYARIVEETALLRRLIEATQEAAALAYESGDDVDNIVDQVEQMVFSVAQRRLSDRFTHIKDLLHEHLEQVEALQLRGGGVTGVPTGYLDLDRLTSGLQSSNLVIVAARPAFGKTSFALNMAQSAATEHGRKVAIFSLEMSKMELVQRLVCAEALVDVHKLRTGNLTDNDWSRLANAVGRLAEAPIYIDDTEAVTVLEIRAKARRLKQKSGLDLVIVDYLQLMQGPRRSENRQQEISEISRSLKILARELQVPVVAVSQLSRAVESRQDKRPMLADLRECVTGETLVCLADGRRAPICDLVGTQPTVLAVSDDGRVVRAPSDAVWRVGRRPVHRLRLASGRTVRATADHRFLTGEGWARLGQMSVGDRVAVARRIPEPVDRLEWPDDHLVLLGHLIGDGSYLSGQPMRYTSASEENLSAVATAAERGFGCTVNRHAGRGAWSQLVISGNGSRWRPAGVNAWLRRLGIFNQRSRDKRVPADCFRLPRRQVALLLRHLWATDGSIFVRAEGHGSHRVYFSTSSEGLARDVAALLLRLGIVARIRERESLYTVDVSGTAFQRLFLEEVGGFGPRAAAAEALSRALEGVVPVPNVDTLPAETFRSIRTSMAERGITTREMAALRGTSYGGSSHFSFAPSRAVVAQYAALLEDDDLAARAVDDLFWDTVVSIEPDGTEDVYDLTVPGPASWLADGIVSHNSGAIEQDADIVMFIYRDEVYNHDSPDKGTAEVIVAKHRNGPVGTVKLTFLPNYTKFADYASA